MPFSNLPGTAHSILMVSDNRLLHGYAYCYKISTYTQILLLLPLPCSGNAGHWAIPASAYPGSSPSGHCPGSSLSGSCCWQIHVLLPVPDHPANSTGVPCPGCGIQSSVPCVWRIASSGADSTSSFAICRSTDMPIVLSPQRSMTQARQKRPSSIRIYVMLLSIFCPGLSVARTLFRIFYATGRMCLTAPSYMPLPWIQYYTFVP